MTNLNSIYSPKQVEIFKRTRQEDWFMLINHGAKRAGKTQLNNDLFINEIIRVKKLATEQGVGKPMYILGGVSSKTIYTNVLHELMDKYGMEFKFDKYGTFDIMGVKIIQAYTGTIAGLGNIRGMTAYGAYINEASLANEEVFSEIVSRCSGEGARIICDTNPDHPEHWLKKKYIDNPSSNILDFRFTLTDNTFLSERYKKNIIETTPSGMFTDRGIHGLWTIGEGAIYTDFDNKVHFIDDEDIPYDEIEMYYAGVDWGYAHYGSIVVIGETYAGVKYLVYEVAEQYKDIEHWVDEAKAIEARYGPSMMYYCDSARPEYVKRFQQEGLKAINASKSVLSGIELVARGFKEETLFISSGVERFREEIYQYIWNEQGRPVDKNDDVLDSLRYAIYTRYVLDGLRDTNYSGAGAR